jgi:hypothetical protein
VPQKKRCGHQTRKDWEMQAGVGLTFPEFQRAVKQRTVCVYVLEDQSAMYALHIQVSVRVGDLEFKKPRLVTFA